jgi:thiol-disulfide isomerase/thioredoxin
LSEGFLQIPEEHGPPWRGEPWLKLRFLLVEPPNRRHPFVLVDIDRNGTFSPDERFSFSRTSRRHLRGAVQVDLPTVSGSAFARYPIELAVPDDSYKELVSRDRDWLCLVQSSAPLVTARVRIDGRDLFFRYSIASDATTLDVKGGAYQAVDDGRLQLNPLSPLHGMGHGAEVFRIGTRYVSTDEVDLPHRTVVIRSRDPSDYHRLELRRGLVIPDFGFEDIDGRSRRLSEFRGRYVLLNFWYTGCGPCLEEFPHLKTAEARFAARGLTMVGLSESGSPAEIRARATPSGTTWIEAKSETVYTLIRQWFRITALPTQLLLDPAGQVIVVGSAPKEQEPPLRQQQLLKTLDEVLPRASVTPLSAR